MLLHLLLLLLPLLHFFHHLLRSTGRPVGPEAGPRGVLRLRGLRLFFRLLWYIFVLILLRAIHASGRAGRAALSRTEHNLARRSLADVSGKQDVVPGTMQQLREHIACLARTVDSINALVGAHPLHL